MSEKITTPAAEGEVVTAKTPAKTISAKRTKRSSSTTALSAAARNEVGANYPTSAEMLIAQAIEKNLPPETMEKFFAMRRELRAEQAKEHFDQALSGFQSDCPIIEKTKKVFEKNNPNKVRYTYAPLDVIIKQVKPFLKIYGLSYSIDTEFNPDWQTVVCTVKHLHGHNEKSTFKVPIDKESYMNAPQKFASALTFAKRYAFCNAFGILSGDEDDDAQSVEVTNAPRPPAAAPAQRPPMQPQNRPANPPPARPIAPPPARPVQPATPPLQNNPPGVTNATMTENGRTINYRAPAYNTATSVTRPVVPARRSSTQEPTGAANEKKCATCGWWHTRPFPTCKDCYFGVGGQPVATATAVR